MGRGTKGLQQYFSPTEAAVLIHNVIGDKAVLDPTAGNGMLLSAFPEKYRYGIEIDPDMTEGAEYRSLTADFQKAFMLMKRLDMHFPAVVMNPPFGLMWDDVEYGRKSSTLIAYLYGLQLMDPWQGQGVLICGKNRYEEEIAGRDEAKHIYAIIQCPDLFKDEDADIDCVIAFFTYQKIEDKLRWFYDIARFELPRYADVIMAQRNRMVKDIDTYDYTFDYQLHELNEEFDAVVKEYHTRFLSNKETHTYSIKRAGNKIRIDLTPYESVLLSKRHKLPDIESLNKQSLSYFNLNGKAWTELTDLEAEGIITIEPKMITAIEDLLADVTKKLCPLYPIKPQQRLGFLSDISQIECIKSDASKGYEAGKTYSVEARTQVRESRYSETKITKEGELKDVEKVQVSKVLKITIDKHNFTETANDMQYVIDHFDIPYPRDVMILFPEEMKKYIDLVDDIETRYGIKNDWLYKDFQSQDLARLLLKGSGLLSWEQGLGKTLGGLTFAKASVELGAKDRQLFICQQDLVPQWKKEALKFFGKEVEIIRNIADARRVRKRLLSGETGWFITYFEALSRNGRACELLDKRDTIYRPTGASIAKKTKDLIYRNSSAEKKDAYRFQTTGRRGVYLNPYKNSRKERRDTKEYFEYANIKLGKYKDKLKAQKYNAFCPQCSEPARHKNYNDWYPDKGYCKACGYKHIKYKVKPAYSHLTKCFSRGSIIIDEGTRIKANTSLTSLSVRGLRARFKLLLTGTPIRNYINDAFWLLYFSLGNASARFPFDYEGGYTKFMQEFAVMEYTINDGKRSNGRILPEVSNLAMLWKLLCSSIIRRRKEETGESLVERILIPIMCPFGEKQKEMYANWLDKENFATWFIETHPASNISNYPGSVEAFSAILGQLAKLEQTSILPESESSSYWGSGSNYTPANMKVLELAKQHAEKGDKVLIGSSVKGFGPWVADLLNEKGIPAIHLVDETGNTKSPSKRAGVVSGFKADPDQLVLCATIQSMQLGHNIPEVNVLIIHGLPWTYSELTQFCGRVHRLNSKKPVKCYIIMTENTIDCRKYELVNEKGASSQMVLDGEIFEQSTQTVDKQQVLDALIKQGVPAGNTVPESQIKAIWNRTPMARIPKKEERVVIYLLEAENDDEALTVAEKNFPLEAWDNQEDVGDHYKTGAKQFNYR